MCAAPAFSEVVGFTPDTIVQEVKDLPSAPKVLPRLKRLLRDPNSSMAEIVALIRLDPGIAARVLRIGNSAYYAKGVSCYTVDDAVNRVGYEEIYELVSYAVASQVLVRPLAVYGIEADELWRRSVACALAAEMLAAETGEDRSVAYTVGLLHGVGMAAIDTWALRHGPTLLFSWDALPKECIESERKLLGFCQADVGSALLRAWDFPIEMWEPLRWQYVPRSSSGYLKMACLVHAAKWLRSALCVEDGAAAPRLPEENLLLPIRFTRTKLARLLPELKQRFANVRSLLEVV